MTTEYSFCEASTAGSRSRWHIRPLTRMGKKLSGGADTMALCGRQVAWDINCNIHPAALEGACMTCAEIYKDRVEETL
jgi:hypothetical protein